SPYRQKMRNLWEGLSTIIPFRGVPSVAINEFNALLSSSDKKRGRRDGIWAIGNELWVRAFPSCTVTPLPTLKSNHRPLLISLKSMKLVVFKRKWTGRDPMP
ncbi:hypothetical protein J1N35_043408, partial [Gossypium stocksii]